MATEKIYYVNQYETQMDALVRSCEEAKGGWRVLLDRTVFFPTGGGQPCDLGTLGEANVLDVSDEDGEVVHLCDRPLSVGAEVHGEIDWARRFSLMQNHSGEQLVSGIVHSRFGYDNVGFHMGSEVITIDFSGELSPEVLREIEAEANAAVYRNIPCKIFWPDPETLRTLPYRKKKELTGQVRLVQFSDIDLCACCGLHVAHSGEIGLIKLLTTTKFHQGSRVELLCGSRAFAYLNGVYDQNRENGAMLSAKPMETATALRRLLEEQRKLELRCGHLEAQLFALRAKTLENAGDVLLIEEAMSGESTRRLCDAVMQTCGGTCAVFSQKEVGYSYAMGCKDGDVRELARRLNAQLQGRGGGKPGFVQGSVAASRKEIEAFFAKEKE